MDGVGFGICSVGVEVCVFALLFLKILPLLLLEFCRKERAVGVYNLYELHIPTSLPQYFCELPNQFCQLIVCAEVLT